MTLTGQIHNGVVVFDAPPPLPEGATVTVFVADPAPPPGQRVTLPLVRTGEPGTVHLTNARIAEIAEEEDVEYARRQRVGGDDLRLPHPPP